MPKAEFPSDPVLALCGVIEKMVSELAACRERDAKIIKSLCDTVILHGNADLQARRIELETVGTAQSRAAEAYRESLQNVHLNGAANPDEPDLVIPGRA